MFVDSPVIVIVGLTFLFTVFNISGVGCIIVRHPVNLSERIAVAALPVDRTFVWKRELKRGQGGWHRAHRQTGQLVACCPEPNVDRPLVANFILPDSLELCNAFHICIAAATSRS